MPIERSVAIQANEECRPISIREYRASIWMVVSAAFVYVLIMTFLVP